MFTYARLTGYF